MGRIVHVFGYKKVVVCVGSIWKSLTSQTRTLNAQKTTLAPPTTGHRQCFPWFIRQLENFSPSTNCTNVTKHRTLISWAKQASMWRVTLRVCTYRLKFPVRCPQTDGWTQRTSCWPLRACVERWAEAVWECHSRSPHPPHTRPPAARYCSAMEATRSSLDTEGEQRNINLNLSVQWQLRMAEMTGGSTCTAAHLQAYDIHSFLLSL